MESTFPQQPTIPLQPHRDFFDDYIEDKPINEVTTSTTTGALASSLKNRVGVGGHYTSTDRDSDQLTLLESLHSNTIGSYDMIQTPFGLRKLTYADYTASGRALQGIEDYLQHEVLPIYGNTHTSSNTTGLQTTLFRHEARDIIRRTCRASLTEDSVLFAGSGATAAIDTAISILQLKSITEYCHTNGLPLPVVIIGPYEHHSNILPWKECGVKLVTISERSTVPLTLSKDQLFTLSNLPTSDMLEYSTVYNNTNDQNVPAADSVTLDDSTQNSGLLSQSHLTAVLDIVKNQYHSPFIITSFSAASNITGKLEDTTTLTAIAKSFGALTLFDYASAASSTKIDMNPSNLDYLKKDMIFFSPHKLLGGVGTPGVLIVKNYILSRTFKPSVAGGGTVFFVSPKNHVYLNNFHEREEGGTPDIMGSIRCGLVFKLKEQLGTQPTARINAITKATLNVLTQHPFIQVIDHDIVTNDLKSPNSNRLSIANGLQYTGTISFLVYSTPVTSQSTTSPQSGKLLPPQFVASLLNDLFGIQTRHGCLCAGPYSHSLLGMDEGQSQELLAHLCEKHEDQRPGVTRLSLHYSMPLYVIEYIMKSILWVATHGVKLLPLYKCVVSSGEWRHHTRRTKAEDRRWLNAINFTSKNGGFDLEVASKRIMMQTAIPFLSTQSSSSSNPFASFTPSVPATTTRTQLGKASVTDEQINLDLSEQLTLGTYLVYANHLVSEVSCTFNTTTTLGTTTWSDTSLLLSLYAITDQTIASLQQHSFTTPHPTFNQTLPLTFSSTTNALALNNIKPINGMQPQQLVEFFTGTISTSPKLSQLFTATSSIPPHPQDFPVWFPTPAQVYATLPSHISRLNPDSQQWTFSPADFYQLKLSLIQAELAHPTPGLLPICPLHPGTVLTNSGCCSSDTTMSDATATTSPSQKDRLGKLNDSLLKFLSTQPLPSTLPQLDPFTPASTIAIPKKVAILQPLWLTMQHDSSQLNLESLCINCWHRHGGSNNTSAHPNSKECVSCECVQFLSAAASTTTTTKPAIATSVVNVAVPSAITAVANENTTQAAKSPQFTTAVSAGSWDNLSKKQQKATFRRILGKNVSEAMIDFDMVRPGDKILVGVSGGKDSLSLIHALLEIKKTIPIPFEIGAATIDPMTADYDPSPLKDYFSSLGITYYYESFPIMSKALEVQGSNPKFSICSFCSRMRRGILYSLCRKNQYNVLALGQHLDDFAESFVMSAFHNASLNTMKPHYTNNKGDLRIIRPLCYTRESKTREFAKLRSLPIISENCPACFEAPKERARVKLMLAAQEAIHPSLYQSIGGAMKPLMQMGQYTTPEDKAATLIKYLSTQNDQEDEAPTTTTTTGPATGLTAPRASSGVREKSISKVPRDLAPKKNSNTTKPLPATNDDGYDSLANQAAQGGEDSGDEECAECVDYGGGLACPIKRPRPNPTKQDLDEMNDENL